MAKRKRGAGAGGRASGLHRRAAVTPDSTSQLSPRKLIGVWAGSRMTLGLTASLEEVVARVRRYSLLEVCSAVGRISAVLHNAKSDQEVQFRLAAGLLGRGRALDLAQRLEFHRRRGRERGEDGSNYVLFGSPTLNALLQVAFRELPPDGPETGVDLGPLAEALLMLGDLIDKTAVNPGHASFGTPEGRRKWAYYAATELMVPGSDPAVHLVVRAADLFVTEAEDLREHPDYIDLRSLLEEATGLPPEAHLLSILLFTGTMYGVTAENAAERSTIIDASSFRGAHLRFSDSQIESFLRLGGKPALEVANEARRFYPPERLRPAFLLPFEQSPLVRFGDRAVCVSVPLLERRMTAGLYHILFNSRPPGDPLRDRFMRFIGIRWGRYVERAFQRMAVCECENARAIGAKPIRRRRGVMPVATYFTESELRQALDTHLEQIGRRPRRGETPSLCDGVLLVGNTAILIEVKAKMFSLASRSGDDEAQFYARLDEITVDAAGQLDASIAHVASGAFVRIGLDPARITRVVPLVVSLQDLRMTPTLRDVILDRVQSKGYLETAPSGIAVEPLHVLDPGDLEWLELVVEQRRTRVPEFLRQWQQDDVGRGVSLASWSAAIGVPGGLNDGRLRYHSARWDELTAGAVEYFRAHRVPGVPEPDET